MLVTLLALFPASTLAAAPSFLALQCLPLPRYPSPPPKDCLTIASHIPFFPNPETTISNGHVHSPSFPFFPQAYFLHGQCVVRVSYSSIYPPLTDGFGMVLNLNQDVVSLQVNTPDVPLSAASVATIWNAARSVIVDVVDECLYHDRAGYAWADVDIPEIGNAWYLVQVVSDDERLPTAIAEERAALTDLHPGSQGGGFATGNHYRMAIWEIP